MFPIIYVIHKQPRTAWGAEKWSELNEKQFLPAVKTIFMAMKRPEAKYQIPLYCSNLPKDDYLQFNPIQSAQVLAAFDHLMLFNDLPDKWMLPKLEIPAFIPTGKEIQEEDGKKTIFVKVMPTTTLYGPDDKLKNLVFEEFMYAESMLDAYRRFKKQTYLDQFIAILYRPKGGNKDRTGDIREPFNKHSVDRRALAVASLDEATKFAVELNYLGCKARFPALYKSLFSEVNPDQNAGPARGSFSWLDVAHRIAEHRPSEIETLKRQNLHEVLASLNLKVKDNEALKAEIEAMRRKSNRK